MSNMNEDWMLDESFRVESARDFITESNKINIPIKKSRILCIKCNSPVENEQEFCPQCGHHLKQG